MCNTNDKNEVNMGKKRLELSNLTTGNINNCEKGNRLTFRIVLYSL